MDLIRITNKDISEQEVDLYIGLSSMDWKRIKLIQGLMRYGIAEEKVDIGDPTDELMLPFIMKMGIRATLECILNDYDFNVSEKE